MGNMDNIVVYYDPKSPAAEAYRSIRTSIRFENMDQKVKTIVVTSAKSGEGKTTVAANIAVSLSLLGNKVVVVDCDFRKPSVHRIFGIMNRKGIADMLLSEDKTGYEGYVKNILGSVDVIIAGHIPPNPSEMLSLKSMESFLETLKSDYDYVVIDTPPIGSFTDASVMSAYTDGVILVCGSGHVEAEMAQKAKRNLDKVNANILGIVLNDFKGQDSGNSKCNLKKLNSKILARIFGNFKNEHKSNS